MSLRARLQLLKLLNGNNGAGGGGSRGPGQGAGGEGQIKHRGTRVRSGDPGPVRAL